MRTLTLSVMGALATMTSACHHGDGAAPGDGGVDDGSAGSGTMTTGTAAATGTFRIVAVDATTEATVDASVYVDGTPVPGGSVMHATGRALVDIVAPGYFAQRREIAVTSHNAIVEVRLWPSVPTAVGAAGTSASADAFQLAIPAGAVPDSSMYSSVFLTKAEIVRVGPPPQFISESDGRAHRVVAGVFFDLSTAPAQVVSFTVPVPVHAPTTTVTGWSIGNDGQWSTPLTPAAQTATSATFTTSASTLRLGVSVDFAPTAALSATPHEEGDDEGALVMESSPTATAETADGTIPLVPGTVVPYGASINAGSGGCSLSDQRGDILAFGARSTASIDVCANADCAIGALDVQLRKGRIQALDNHAAPAATGRNKLFIRTRVVAIGVRGTVLSVDTKPCSDIKTIDDIDVYEGTAVVDSNNGTSTLNAGDASTLCSTCKQGETAVCCLAFDPAYFMGTFNATHTGSLVGTAIDAGVSGNPPTPVETCVSGVGNRTIDGLTNDGETLLDVNPLSGTVLTIDSFDHETCAGHATAISDYLTEDQEYQLVDGVAMHVKTTISARPNFGSGSCTLEYDRNALYFNPY